jgi:phosphate transport system ATP-binding protein
MDQGIGAARMMKGRVDMAKSTASKIQAEDVSVFYGEKQALFNVSLDIENYAVTSLIGPSGCGKSTFLRCFNRMNDVIPHCRVTGSIRIDGIDLNSAEVDPVLLRARVGMVFQKANPFPRPFMKMWPTGRAFMGLRQIKMKWILLSRIV